MTHLDHVAFSDDDANAALVRLVQDTIADLSDPVGTLWDLPGLKCDWRFCRWRGGAEPGGAVPRQQWNRRRAPGLPALLEAAHSRVGDLLRLDDGRLTLRVTEVTLYRLTTEAVAGGVLSANKASCSPTCRY